MVKLKVFIPQAGTKADIYGNFRDRIITGKGNMKYIGNKTNYSAKASMPM